MDLNSNFVNRAPQLFSYVQSTPLRFNFRGKFNGLKFEPLHFLPPIQWLVKKGETFQLNPPLVSFDLWKAIFEYNPTLVFKI